MMFFDDEIKKEIPESSFMRPGDEIISIHEVCLNDKYDRKDSRYNSEPLLSSSGKNDLFRDGFFPESLDQQQARFAWTEEDGNIAALVSEPGFGTTGQTTFGKDLDAALKREMKEVDTSCGVFQHTVTQKNGFIFSKKPGSMDSQIVSSTSSDTLGLEKSKSRGACKVDKADPRSRFHYVKYVKRHGRTVKLWECGICSREFQHQYTLMRHLPTHTDERNFHCDTCGKSFRQLSTLSQHRAIHSADRPYSCEVCNKTFNRVSTLISHRRTHSDDKPYKCHICPKGFHQKGNLRNHLFTHTNERPYRCNVCFKGFNQQSNLVCHKNKAHSGNNCTIIPRGGNNLSTPTRLSLEMSNSNKSADDCEVSSSIGPYLPSIEGPSTSSWPKSWETPKAYPKCGDIWNSELSGSPSSGVVVDPIKTYHMEVALATKQTPFALLKPDNGTPVLVKVVDTKLPGGKQMLVPATAEDLRVGGKIVVENEDAPQTQNAQIDVNMGVQIRVPVVATVVPKINSSGRLHLSVEEPHHAYHTALSAEVGEVKVEPCTVKEEPQCSEPRHRLETCSYEDNTVKLAERTSSSCALLQSPPSPPLDLISLDLFEPMECIPMGPQITAVDIENSPPSDDSDIFIGQFEEGIPLSDSD